MFFNIIGEKIMADEKYMKWYIYIYIYDLKIEKIRIYDKFVILIIKFSALKMDL